MTRPGDRQLSHHDGFTLIELLLVIVIVAVTANIALPRWAASVQNYQLKMAGHQVIADLALAQSRANYSSAAVTVAFNTSAGTYQVLGMTDPNRGTGTYTVNLAAAPYRIAMASASFNGATQITFDAYGTPTQGGTIVLASGNRQLSIVVDATSGKAVVQ